MTTHLFYCSDVVKEDGNRQQRTSIAEVIAIKGTNLPDVAIDVLGEEITLKHIGVMTNARTGKSINTSALKQRNLCITEEVGNM